MSLGIIIVSQCRPFDQTWQRGLATCTSEILAVEESESQWAVREVYDKHMEKSCWEGSLICSSSHLAYHPKEILPPLYSGHWMSSSLRCNTEQGKIYYEICIGIEKWVEKECALLPRTNSQSRESTAAIAIAAVYRLFFVILFPVYNYSRLWQKLIVYIRDVNVENDYVVFNGDLLSLSFKSYNSTLRMCSDEEFSCSRIPVSSMWGLLCKLERILQQSWESACFRGKSDEG